MFVPRIPNHRERIDWLGVTHVRLKPDAKADTPAAARILEHIGRTASTDGIASVQDLEPSFPSVRKLASPRQSMRANLRHLGNLRNAGEREQDKGLIELGTLVGDTSESPFPEEVAETVHVIEGASRRVSVNVYERDRGAREHCIAKWGLRCVVCNFDFEQVYGGRGAGFIHVHHLRSLASIGVEYKLDPVADLRPVCPNCHAMIHRFDPPLSIEDMQRVVIDMQNSGA